MGNAGTPALARQHSADQIDTPSLVADGEEVDAAVVATNIGNGAITDLASDFHLDNVMVSIPEPASFALLALGGMLLTSRRRVL